MRRIPASHRDTTAVIITIILYDTENARGYFRFRFFALAFRDTFTLKTTAIVTSRKNGIQQPSTNGERKRSDANIF